MSKGLPGLRGMEHVGLTVPDFDAAIDFFVDIVGCEFILDGGWEDGPTFMTRQLGVDATARMRWGFLRCAAGPNLEIFQYEAPDQALAPPRNSDIGGHHLAFYVDDIDAAIGYLRHHDIEIMGEIQTIETGPASGSRWIYFRAPWGLQLELVCYPDGKGGPDSPARRLWHPAHPDQ